MKDKSPPAIVRIHRPELTEEERAKRMEGVKRAAIQVLLAAYRTKPTQETGAR